MAHANNAQKRPFARSIHLFGDNKVQDWLQRLQQPLPCHVDSVDGQIVTVSFDVNSAPYTLPKVQMAKAQSQYALEPTQVGDKGLATYSSLYLGGETGLGGGQADLYERVNLTNLVFLPVSNKSWTTPDGSLYVVQGPNGVLIQSLDGSVKVTVSKTKITIDPGAATVYLGGDGVAGLYDYIQTTGGPSINVKAKHA